MCPGRQIIQLSDGKQSIFVWKCDGTGFFPILLLVVSYEVGNQNVIPNF